MTILVDLLIAPDDVAGLKTLLRWVDRAARAEDSDKVRCYVMNGPFRRVLRRNGYFNVKSTLEVSVKVNAVQVPKGFYDDTNGWHVTSGIRIRTTDMSLNQQIASDLTAAMKARDAGRLSALRMLKAAVMNKGVEKRRDLEDAEVLQVVASLVKQRRDSIEQFAKAGRTDLVDKETGEMGCWRTTCRRPSAPRDRCGGRRRRC